jgi:hypothetical protein
MRTQTWLLAHARGRPLVVLEDDVDVPPDFLAMMQRWVRAPPSGDWDMLHFGVGDAHGINMQPQPAGPVPPLSPQAPALARPIVNLGARQQRVELRLRPGLSVCLSGGLLCLSDVSVCLCVRVSVCVSVCLMCLRVYMSVTRREELAVGQGADQLPRQAGARGTLGKLDTPRVLLGLGRGRAWHRLPRQVTAARPVGRRHPLH